MHAITMIVPYYRNPKMLREQLEQWKRYGKALNVIRFIVVDDGSPDSHASDLIDGNELIDFMGMGLKLDIYRIKEDIPWNRGGARNLGAHVASSKWLLHLDVDHVLKPEEAGKLASNIGEIPSAYPHRFRRFRRGRADETRMKDAIPRDVEYGEIKPHIDSYLCTRELYWAVGGYDEDYSGCLGGGSPFLARLNRLTPFHTLLGISLEVYTHDAISDSSDMSLSRDKAEYLRRKSYKERNGLTVPMNPLRFEWSQVL